MSKIYAFSCAQNQSEWLKSAIRESGLNTAEFLRQSAFRAASAMCGEDAPDRERAADLIAEAAAKHGLNRKQFVKFATLVAAGLDADVAMARASVVRRRKVKQPEADAE